MKTVRRLVESAVLLSAVFTLAAANIAAQNPCDDADGIAALDAKVRNNFEKIETLEIALEAAKQYVPKYGECPDAKKLAEWVKPQLPSWEKRVADYKEYLWRKPRVEKFDAGIQNKKFDDVYAAGAELVKRYPDDVNFMLPLALIGLSESYKNNFKYNDDSIRYAKMALAKFKSGTPEPNKKDGKPLFDANGKELYGPFHFERTKENAISELTYAMAYILYHAKKDKRAGLLYYYEASQLPGSYKQEPRLYATVGQYYVEEAAPIGKEIVALMEKQKVATTDEEKEKLEAEIKPKVALFNGYNERAVDAFSRAYKFYDEKVPSEKAAKTQLFSKLLSLLRVEAAGLDKRIAAAIEKPFPDPTSAVTPIDDPEPAAARDVTSPASTKPVPAKAKRRAPRKPRR